MGRVGICPIRDESGQLSSDPSAAAHTMSSGPTAAVWAACAAGPFAPASAGSTDGGGSAPFADEPEHCAQCCAVHRQCAKCAPRPVQRPLVSVEYVESEDEAVDVVQESEDVQAPGAQLVLVGGDSNSAPQVSVSSWPPRGTEKLWFDIISKSTPELAQTFVGFICSAM